MEILYLLLILMIAGAIIALEVKDLLSSVVAIGAVGLGLSVVFLLLQAPDIAITQLAVEIIAVIFLIRATIRRRLESSPTEGRLAGLWFGASFGLVFIGTAVFTLRELPSFGNPIMRVANHYLANGLEQTGAANLVTSIILDYRGYDTLGEATVLFAAVLGVLTLLRTDRPAETVRPAGSEPSEVPPGMTVIVKTITRLTVGLILLYGIYIVAHGHLTPGGGFVGGIIIALSFVHLALAYGRDSVKKALWKSRAELFEDTGALLFLGLALAGFLGGAFFRNVLPPGEPFQLFSAGAIPLMNIAICMKVGAGLLAIFLALVLFRFDWEEEQ